MNRFRFPALATVLLVALFAYGQQNSGTPAGAAKASQQSTSSKVDRHLEMLTEKLGLTSDQQARLRPVVQQMIDDHDKLMQDKTLTEQNRRQRMKALHDEADRQARPILTDEQKKKLDELESEHHEQHDH